MVLDRWNWVMAILMLVPFFGESQAPAIKKLDAYIEQARQDWDVPGMSVAIVQDGEVLLSKGYGVTRAQGGKPVGDHTLFAMASTTKAMVAVGMATLVDAGLVDWDDPVVDHLPEFQLSVPYVTQTVRIRDLFTHNVGLGNADHLWVHGEFISDEILKRISKLPFSYPHRGGYTYQNIMYLVAGKVIERVSGMSWPEFMQQRIYEPLGMRYTYPTYQSMQRNLDRARPHHLIEGEVTTIEDMIADPIAPAGASWSCAYDMARWMIFLLDTARINDHQWLQSPTWAELFRPQILIPGGSFYPTRRLTQPHWMSYGLGWFQHDYRGEMVQFHTGSLNGTVAICGLLPEKKLGVYVFGNLDHAEVRHAIMYRVFDVLGFGRDDRDWSQEFRTLYAHLAEANQKERAKWVEKRIRGTQPTLALKAYTGTYSHPVWGTIQVEQDKKDDHLVAKIGQITYVDLRHWHYDVFLGDYRTAGFQDQAVQFLLDAEGKVKGLNLGDDRYQFTKTEMKTKVYD